MARSWSSDMGRFARASLRCASSSFVDVLRDPVCLSVVVEHFSEEADQLAGVETTAVHIEMVEELLSRDVCVEQPGVA